MSIRAARPRKRSVRNLTQATMRSVMQNGSQVCELCDGVVAAGNSVWGNSARYMRKHLDRCEMASATERAYFKEKGTWPKVKRRWS